MRRQERERKSRRGIGLSGPASCGIKPSAILSLADLVSPENFKRILRRRLKDVEGRENNFNRDLAEALVQIGREWVKLKPNELAELARLTGKMPMPKPGLVPILTLSNPRRPIAARDGHDLPGLIDERVPGLAAVIAISSKDLKTRSRASSVS